MKGLNYIESSAASGDSMEFKMSGVAGGLPGTAQQPKRYIQSAGYRQPYKHIEEPIAEEVNPNKQRVNTHQFRSTNLESAKGVRPKLVLSKSKEKLRALPYTSSQERLDGLSRASSNEGSLGRASLRRSAERLNEIR